MSRIHSQKNENSSWIKSVRQAIAEERLLGSTCQLYSKKQSNRDIPPSQQCLCGRFPRRHSFNGEPKTDRITDGYWKIVRHAKKSTVTVYGIWNNKTKVFLFELFYSFFYFLQISSFDGILIELHPILQQSEYFRIKYAQ